MVKLVGTSSNRNAIGARVGVRVGGRTLYDEVRGGGSYYAQNDFRVHVGLGSATEVERIEVRWPNGVEETWAGVAADRLITLKEGTGAKAGPKP